GFVAWHQQRLTKPVHQPYHSNDDPYEMPPGNCTESVVREIKTLSGQRCYRIDECCCITPNGHPISWTNHRTGIAYVEHRRDKVAPRNAASEDDSIFISLAQRQRH